MAGRLLDQPVNGLASVTRSASCRKAHALRRGLSVSAAQADVAVTSRKSARPHSSVSVNLSSPSAVVQLVNTKQCMRSHDWEGDGAEVHASEDAVLVVGAGIAGLATAAALHKVLFTAPPDAHCDLV